ncbi:aladin-like [Drosophila innubila]|uniref:aladin-like n=1 Tax=Drosophila innubila TaxID=198719 RepID=UPI00148CF47F|nr:aladin-like [Drosophila innubila]
MTLQHIAQFNDTCDWITAPIRRIIFNPYGPERVLLTRDDTVMLFLDKDMDAIKLRYFRQLHISCGAFRPWTGNELAVGGAGGICLWYQGDMEMPHELYPFWISLQNEEDFVLNLQWLRHGHHFACALLYARCIQLWQPETLQVMQEIQMRYADSFLWALSYQPDIEELFLFLNTDKDNSDDDNNDNNHEDDSTNDYDDDNDMDLIGSWHYDSFQDWEVQITGTQILQSACWTTLGHFLFVARNCCKVFSCTPHAEHGIFLNPREEWSVEIAIDLSFIEIDGLRYNCSEPQALSIDPCNIHVAILLKRQPYLLLCLHHADFGCQIRLTPLQVIQVIGAHPCFNIYPTCCTFAADDDVDNMDVTDNDDEQWEQMKYSLFIGWSSGYVQQVTLGDTDAEETR